MCVQSQRLRNASESARARENERGADRAYNNKLECVTEKEKQTFLI